MSDELFEVAFSGQIKEGADLEQVKAKVGHMFKADATKLAHLFSGKRMVIKKNIDQSTAEKYKTALSNAGAICEIKSLTEVIPVETSSPKVESTVKPEPEVQTTASREPLTSHLKSDAPEAPNTVPLGIGVADISELSAGIAPVGSNMQDEVEEVGEPQLDISGLDMAPAGSDLGQTKKDDDPPPPSTDGLSLLD